MTDRLTADCSTAELSRNETLYIVSLYYILINVNQYFSVQHEFLYNGELGFLEPAGAD